MNNGNVVLSYALVTIASLCFIGGVVILSGGRVDNHGKFGDDHIHTR